MFTYVNETILKIIRKYLTLILLMLYIFPSQLLANTPTSSYSGNDNKNLIQLEELEKASSKLFAEANKLFNNGNYWESARNLIILLDFNPQYSKIDEVIFTLGDCLYEIGLNEGSKKIFKYLVKKFISSPQLPRAILGLQRIEYNNGNIIKCIDYYKVIERGNPRDEILDCSQYYAGLSYYKLNDYNKAIEILSKINKSNPYWAYGQYTCAMSYLRLKKVQQAVDTLNGILRVPVVNDEIRNIVDETHLTLGYIYYELGYYDHGLRQFTSVSSNHVNYKDALLSAGWAATKIEDYERAIIPLTDLVSLPNEDDNTQEGFFLLGRCYLKLGLYDDALKVYEYLVNVLPKKELVPLIVEEVEKSIAVQEKRIEKIKLDLLVLETKLLNLIQLSPNIDTPDYLQQEKQEINLLRNNLLTQIQQERQTFQNLLADMNDMKQAIQTKENRQDWRAFAEYGKSRALFLKRTASNR
ncbi:tetratricopeptide repeat protein [candidate division KSB1 bacterium]|nr:tetratricopeptide repeat protein [candidate division KSB1 bacterium]